MENRRQEILAILSRINRKLFTANGLREDSLIGMGQINILKEIIKNENITQDELASILNLDKTTIAKAVKRLESHELITRKRNEADHRKKELAVTDKALLVKEKMSMHMDEKTQSLFEGISEQEIDTFKGILGKIENNLERNRSIMNDKKLMGMKMIKLIEENKDVTVKKLSELLENDISQVKVVVETLIKKGFLEEQDEKLHVTQFAKEHIKGHGMETKEHGRGTGKE